MKKLTSTNRAHVIKNKIIKQSYVITTARYDYTVYEKRILYRVTEMLFSYNNGYEMCEGCSIDPADSLGGRVFRSPISYFILKGEDKRYDMLKGALDSLTTKKFTYQISRPEKKLWETFYLIESPRIESRECEHGKLYVSFRLPLRIYDALLDFSKGWRKYELKTAMSLKSVYSMRFYELLAKQRLLTRKIDTLKLMFMLENSYKNTNDFIRNVIIPAQKELCKSAPYSFTYSTKKIGRKITTLTFIPVCRPKNSDLGLESDILKYRVDLSWSLTSECQQYLIQTFKFTIPELKRNSDLWKETRGKFNLLPVLKLLKRQASSANNPKGYIINTIKAMNRQCEFTAPTPASTSPSIQSYISKLSEKLTKR